MGESSLPTAEEDASTALQALQYSVPPGNVDPQTVSMLQQILGMSQQVETLTLIIAFLTFHLWEFLLYHGDRMDNPAHNSKLFYVICQVLRRGEPSFDIDIEGEM